MSRSAVLAWCTRMRPTLRHSPLLLGVLTTLLVGSSVAAAVAAQAGVQDGSGAPVEGSTAGTAGEGSADEEALIRFAVEQSQRFFPDQRFAHGIPAEYIVLSRVDAFADSLAASALLEPASILYTRSDALPAIVEEELARVMPGGGPVLLLGGERAISPEVEARLVALGHEPRRLEGPTRVETALAIADAFVERNGPVTRVALARASGPTPTAEWADAIAAAPFAADQGVPILLTRSGSLDPAVEAWMADNGIESTALLGGEAALSPAVAEAVPGATRYAGPNRWATAAVIAEDLWTTSAYNFRVVAGDHPLGWGYALASVPLAVEGNSPIALVGTDRLPDETSAMLCSRGNRAFHRVLGDTDVVSQSVRDALAEPCPEPTPAE